MRKNYSNRNKNNCAWCKKNEATERRIDGRLLCKSCLNKFNNIMGGKYD